MIRGGIKTLLTCLYFIMILVNFVFYFLVVDELHIGNYTINMVYVVLTFVVLEGIFVVRLYSKQKGLISCMILLIFMLLNVLLLINNMA